MKSQVSGLGKDTSKQAVMQGKDNSWQAIMQMWIHRQIIDYTVH